MDLYVHSNYVKDAQSIYQSGMEVYLLWTLVCSGFQLFHKSFDPGSISSELSIEQGKGIICSIWSILKDWNIKLIAQQPILPNLLYEKL